MTRRSVLRVIGLPAVLLLTLGVLPAANAEGDDSWIDESLLSGSSDPFYVGGEYSWGLQQVMPQQDPNSVEVTVTFDWGDDTPDTVASSLVATPPSPMPDVQCYGDGVEEPWQCWLWIGHVYDEQGLYTVRATAHQDGSTDCSASIEAAVYDLDVGGSVRGTGTVQARQGGMYDQDFVNNPAPASFSITASRKAGSPSTKAVLKVSVPTMQPDWPEGNDFEGMTFTSVATTRPLYVQRLAGRGNYEVYIERIFGTVSNSGGSAGTAYAQFHALVRKGQTTLVRIEIWNTSMGFSYMGTAVEGQTFFDLISTDELLTGSIRIS